MATHNRRQSGLWAQNNDGFFSQLSGPSASVPEGPYQYYQAPQPRSQDQAQDGRRTFSDRSGNEPPMASPTSQSRSSQGPLQPALTVDPNYAPPNMRSKPWSEDAMTPRTAPEFPLAIPLAMQPQIKPQRQGSNASETRRRGSVPDKSPLQNLEVWSKDEKRARIERAEGKVAREMSGKNGNRAVSDSAAMAQRSRQSTDGPMSPTYMASPTSAGAERIPPSSRKENFAFPNQAKAIDRGQTRARVATDGDIATRTRIKEGGWAGMNNEAAYDHIAAERGRLAYERRKNQMQAQSIMSGESPISPVSRDGQSGSLRIQRREDDGYKPEKKKKDEHNHIKSDRMASVKQERQAAEKYDDPDPIPPEQVRTEGDGVPYSIPPQTAAGQHAREQVGFGNGDVQKDRHHFGGMFHRDHRQHRSYTPEPFLEEWRQAKVAKLTVEDLDLDAAVKASQKEGGDAAWWEKGRRVSSSGSASRGPPPNMAQYDGPYEEQANGFKPRLYLKCGPLLRYTGMRKETSQSRSGRAVEKEVWRGSVMILTEDDQSDISTAPVLRIFAQQMDLMPPPPAHLDSHELPPEFEDPVAGQVKLSRTGRALFVRPVHDIDPSVDLSREENNEGLYAATRTSVLGPTSGPDGRQSQHITFQDKSRIKRQDGEKAGRVREVKAVRLHSERGHTFWRFSIEVELASKQTRVAYRINNGPAVAFWVPGKGDTMNIMFHSCNGFSMSVDSDTFSGPDPLWRDVLNRHQSKPFHVMLGGGDQVYNDAVMRDTELFKQWLQMKNPEHKHHADFTPAMQNELEEFYLNRYAMWFSQGLFGMANSQIPMVNIWDDHDIIDGFGSYPHHFMATRVFTGLGAIAHKYYMLFQHQSLVAETEKDEPSWLLGRSPGPYINQLSRSIFLHLGRKIAFLGLDCRTERMRDEILSQETYDVVFDRLRAELHKDETKHLIVLLGVPIAYPRLNFLENILTSRVMDPIKALGRKGMLGGFVNKFDGGVEILDDLDDHWTAKHHKAERNWLIQELQDLAREKSIRITILGGDVHLAAIGQFYSAKDLAIPKDKDWRYMPNVISSAIVNTPPPNMMADVLNKRNKVHKLDRDTEEVMIPMFSHDVDSSRRNNQALMPRRNFCVISEYVPGSTPPGSPKLEAADGQGGEDWGAFGPNGGGNKDRRFPPGSMKRAMSQGPMSIVRRLSGASKRRPSFDMAQPPSRDGSIQRANSLQQQPTGGDKGYFPHKSNAQRPSLDASATQRRPSFHRAPTDLSKKASRAAAARIGTDGNADGRAPGHIDLEDGLDVSLCVEVDQHDPVGRTIPYRLLVPALWCDGPNRLAGMAGGGMPAGVNEGQKAGVLGGMVQDEHEEGGRGHDRKKRLSLLERLKSMRRREQKSDEQEDDWSQSDSEEEIELRHYDARQQQQQADPRRDQLDGDDGYRPPAPPSKAASANPADALGLSTTGRGAVQPHRSAPSDPQEPILSTAGRQSMDGATRDFHQAQSVGYQHRAQRGQQTHSQSQSQPTNSIPRQVLTKPLPNQTQHQQPHVQHHLFHHQTQHAEAYKQGLSLAGPPIGAHQRQQQTQRQTSISSTNGAFIPTNGRPGGLSNNPNQAVGLKNGAGQYRHSSAPVGQHYQQQSQARGGAPPSMQKPYDDYDEEGYSDEEYDDDEGGYGQGGRGKERRGSKAERFFGLVGGNEGKEGRTGSLKGRGWKVWK